MSATEPGREQLLFEAALLKTEPAERAAFLAAICGEDAALRARLELLLEGHFRDKGFLTSCPTRQVTPAEVPDEPPLSTIDHYRLMEKVGEGGCGVVYVAEQTDPVRRRVALKVIRLGMDTKQVVARFEAERQALAMMDHPNIAKVLDAGTTQTGRPYFVMELVRGIRITDFCDQANLSTRERVELFIRVCQAIQHAHQKGIIHRDIKPSNILVTLHDGVPVPKVIDFGIAKATEGRLTDATVYTQLHQFIGTPAYMSPEQAEMSGLDIDTRSDIYSLGVLLYELLVGSTPFDPKELMRQGLDAMRQTIREREPVRPSTKLATLPGEELTTTAKRRSAEPARLAHLLRGDLDWIVMKCLEKDRTRRYETANGLAADLRRHLNNEPVVARPPSTGYRLQKGWRRNKLVFTSGVAIAAALVIGIGISTWQAVVATQAKTRAVQANSKAVMAQREAEKSQQAEKQQRARAEAGERNAQELLYASDMNLALQALEANSIGYAMQLLDRHRPKPGEPDLRGWEWRYVWKQTRSDALAVLGSHSNTVDDIAFSPKGDLLATCSEDQTVRLWELTTRRERAVLRHPAPVAAARFSADGTSLATACADGNLRLWDAKTYQELRRIAVGEINPSPADNKVAFSQGGELFAFGDNAAAVQVWDVAKGAKVASFQGASARYGRYTLAFSPDRSLLAAGHWGDGTVDLWDLSRRERLCSITNEAQRVWDTLTLSETAHVSLEFRSGTHFAISPLGKVIAVGDPDGGVTLLEVSTQREIAELGQRGAAIGRLVFSRDGSRLAAAAVDRKIRIWDLPTRRMLCETESHANGFNHLASSFMFSADGMALGVGYEDNTAELFQVASGRGLAFLQGHKAPVSGVLLLADRETVVTASYDQAVKLWDRRRNRELRSLPGESVTRFALALSPDEQRLASGDGDGTLKLWDVATSQLVALLKRPAHESIMSLTFSPDGNALVAITWKMLHVWRAPSWEEIRAAEAKQNAER